MEPVIERGNLDEIIILANKLTPLELCIALAYAVKYQHIHIVEYLVECGVDLSRLQTHYSVSINEDSDIVYTSHLPFNPVVEAAKSGNLQILKYLYEHGLPLQNNDSDIMNTVIKLGYLDIIKYFVSIGFILTIYHLQYAIVNNHAHIVDYILSQPIEYDLDELTFVVHDLDILKQVSIHFKSIHSDITLNWKLVFKSN